MGCTRNAAKLATNAVFSVQKFVVLSGSDGLATYEVLQDKGFRSRVDDKRHEGCSWSVCRLRNWKNGCSWVVLLVSSVRVPGRELPSRNKYVKRNMEAKTHSFRRLAVQLEGCVFDSRSQDYSIWAVQISLCEIYNINNP